MTTFTIGYYLFDGKIASMKRTGTSLDEVIKECKSLLSGRGWIIKDQFNNAVAFE